MRDTVFLLYFMWLGYGVGVAFVPETFKPLLWVIGVLSILFILLGMFVESATSDQEFRLKEQEHKYMMERKAFDHQAELNRASQGNKFQVDNSSYFLNGLGAKK